MAASYGNAPATVVARPLQQRTSFERAAKNPAGVCGISQSQIRTNRLFKVLNSSLYAECKLLFLFKNIFEKNLKNRVTKLQIVFLYL